MAGANPLSRWPGGGYFSPVGLKQRGSKATDVELGMSSPNWYFHPHRLVHLECLFRVGLDSMAGTA